MLQYRIARSLLWCFRFGFFFLFALDCWKSLARAPKYGLFTPDFNVPHLSLFLSLPLPTPETMQFVWMLMCFLSLRLSIGISHLSFSPIAHTLEAIVLALLQFYTYFVSQLDLYQHHYLLFLVLVLMVFIEPSKCELLSDDAEEKESEKENVQDKNKRHASKRQKAVVVQKEEPEVLVKCWPIRLILIQMALVYIWTAVAKFDSFWLGGTFLSSMVSPAFNDFIAAVARLFIGTGESEVILVWQFLSYSIIAIEFVLAALLLIYPYPAVSTYILFPLGVMTHIGMESAGLQIGQFSYFMVLLYGLVLPPPLRRLLHRAFTVIKNKVLHNTLVAIKIEDQAQVLYRELAIYVLCVAIGWGATLKMVWLNYTTFTSVLSVVTILTTIDVAYSAFTKVEKDKKQPHKTNKKEDNTQATTQQKQKRQSRPHTIRVIALTFLVCALTVAAFEATTDQSREYEFQAGTMFAQMYRFNDSIKHFRSIVEHPSYSCDALTWGTLASIHEANKEPIKAIEAYRAGLACDPNDLFSMVGVANYEFGSQAKAERTQERRQDACNTLAKIERRALKLHHENCGYMNINECAAVKTFVRQFVFPQFVPSLARAWQCIMKK